MEKLPLNSENNEADNEPINEFMEQIKRRLWEEWESASSSNSIESTVRNEFERLLLNYKNQERPVEALGNLLSTVEKAKDEIEKLALFYKDAVYNSRAKMEDNRTGSLNFALDYIKLLNLPDKDLKRFKDIMMGRSN